MVPNPGARAVTNGEEYVTDRLKVAVARGECSDGMSDRRYRDTVRVTADGKTVKGCGGGILPPTALAGTNWTFVLDGGVPVTAERPSTVGRRVGHEGVSRGSHRGA